MLRPRLWMSYPAIIVVGAALTAGLAGYWWIQYANVQQHYVERSAADARFVTGRVETAFASIYQNIRTLSMLPSIRAIDRHGTTLSAEAKTTIQQIYNNLASSVDVSEVYILPVDFDPEKLDPVTGHHEAPILAFDQLIAPGSSDAADSGAGSYTNTIPPDQDFVGIPDDAGLPQVEIQEYRSLKQQIAKLSASYPTLDKIDGMKVPMIGSPELITCDNTVYDKTRNDFDRLGLVQVVPFYGVDGKLKGAVAAIMRSDAYRALLPDADFALVNTNYGFATRPLGEGQEGASADFVKAGRPDPALVYSEAIPIATADSTSNWNVWVGHPNVAFTSSAEVANLRNSAIGSFAGIAVLMLAAFGVAFLIRRNARAMATAAAGLENRVAERTAEIRELASAAEVENARRQAHVGETNALNADLSEVVGAALAGDFSRRVSLQFQDEGLGVLAHNVNSLIETVDRNIAETGGVLAALAHTDLTKRVTGSYQGALEHLKNDTNSVADRLTEVVRELRVASNTVRVATGELLQGANDLSGRTNQQAESLREVSAAIERLDATTADIARRAGSANSTAGAVAQTASATAQVMDRANEAMGRISAASTKIRDIISLIDDIAFQTNLLALNASVEAARAGDAGKGFAVVAVEVRRLAQSAAGASAQVKELVAQATAEVASGDKLVADAAHSLGSMLDGIRENSELVGGIAQATGDQSATITEISATVRQIGEMTQHNAALVEETNATIEQTESQANQLDRIVDVFVVGDDTTREASAMPRMRPRRVA